jgi:hypothetical protein
MCERHGGRALDSMTTAWVVAIAADDSWAHVYPKVGELLGHRHDGDDVPAGPVEFFDGAGRRLGAVFGPDWVLVDLRPVTAIEDRTGLEERLHRVLRHVAAYLRAHPEALAALPDAPDDVLTEIDDLGSGDLETVLDRCFLSPDEHSAGWLHNALHAAGWSH